MPLQIELINMPFAMLEAPSIALTQLKAVIERTFPERVRTEIHYLNHDIGSLLTHKVYDYVATSMVRADPILGGLHNEYTLIAA
jgi:hypothetical protein